jgi:hypothetical protein
MNHHRHGFIPADLDPGPEISDEQRERQRRVIEG